MSIEAIKEIKDTELKVEEKLKTAQLQAKEIILEAEEKAGKMIKDVADKEVIKSKSFIAKIEEEATKESEIKRQQNKLKCEELKIKAESKMDNAVKMVMERIVNLDGNC